MDFLGKLVELLLQEKVFGLELVLVVSFHLLELAFEESGLIVEFLEFCGEMVEV